MYFKLVCHGIHWMIFFHYHEILNMYQVWQCFCYSPTFAEFGASFSFRISNWNVLSTKAPSISVHRTVTFHLYKVYNNTAVN